jgi:hypothetical protein
MSNFEIVTREDFSDVTYLLEVRHPLMAKAARPGQFVIVMLNEQGERVLKPFGNGQPAVRQQPVIPQVDSQRPENVVADKYRDHASPAKQPRDKRQQGQ